ncbi:MAG: alkaline phosphatase D family protein [Archangiaceae bacterium]|nr:alkaline phosphatase D family protein [Archangiaceae bacterium]
MSLSRRQVSIALASTALVRCGGQPVNEAPAEFPLGVASGDPSADGAILWARYQGSEALKVLVWRATADASTALELSADGPYARVEVVGLDPGTAYRFAFVAGAHRSPEGRFRTAPPAGTRPLVRFGATSCAKYGWPFDCLARAAERDDLDAFLMLGDTVYADEAGTLAQYRDVWARSFVLPAFQSLRARTALIATWDDHEFDNNFGGDNVPPERRQAAEQAFFEHMPGRVTARPIWRSVRFGDTAEVFVLDSRSEREEPRYISAAQMQWLKAALSASTAKFKVMMSSVPIASYAVPFFQPFADDRWEGFPQSRDEILRHIDEQQIGGVLWVAGDFHLACAGRVSAKGVGANQYEVLVGPAAQMPNLSPSYPSGPQFDWSSGINNYTELELDPERGTIRARWFDGRGRALYTRDI